jgi:hypothetical protein
MTYYEFLDQVIDGGIRAAKDDYIGPDEKNKLEGSIAGFEACRNKTSSELLEVWGEANNYANDSFKKHDDPKQYWWFNCYKTEVEWVLNVVSALICISDVNPDREPLLSWLPTQNGMSRALNVISLFNILYVDDLPQVP